MTLRLPVVLIAALALGACSSLGKHVAIIVTPTPLPIATGDYPTLGHAPDYSWISGQIERDLSCTYVRFASPAHAPWGGRVALYATLDQIGALPGGDTVVLKGKIMRLSYGTCGPPSYLVSSVEEH